VKIIIPPEIKYIIGIDEAGRGPFAGPVSVCAFCVPAQNTDFKKFSKGVRDSKKLSEKKRDEWFEKIKEEKRAGKINYAVSFGSADMINKRGLSYAIKFALKKSLKALRCEPKETLVLMDGSLHAPKNYTHQQTIIHGDDKVPVISLASVVAKVTRDRHMLKMGKKYPVYGFEKHKGYGTKAHIKAIKTHGISKIHRKAFIH